MALDDSYDEEPRRKKKGFSLGGWRTLLIVLVAGLLIGGFLEHQYLEPIVSDNAKKLADCSSTNKLLDQEIGKCYNQLADYNAQIKT